LRGGDRIGTQIERAKRLGIDLASDLQPVANLVTPNRGTGLGAIVTSNIAIVKPLIFESLLPSHDAVIRVFDEAGNVVETVIATEITRLLMSFFGGD
jgi:hypothetical protein